MAKKVTENTPVSNDPEFSHNEWLAMYTGVTELTIKGKEAYAVAALLDKIKYFVAATEKKK